MEIGVLAIKAAYLVLKVAFHVLTLGQFVGGGPSRQQRNEEEIAAGLIAVNSEIERAKQLPPIEKQSQAEIAAMQKVETRLKERLQEVDKEIQKAEKLSDGALRQMESQHWQNEQKRLQTEAMRTEKVIKELSQPAPVSALSAFKPPPQPQPAVPEQPRPPIEKQNQAEIAAMQKIETRLKERLQEVDQKIQKAEKLSDGALRQMESQHWQNEHKRLQTEIVRTEKVIKELSQPAPQPQPAAPEQPKPQPAVPEQPKPSAAVPQEAQPAPVTKPPVNVTALTTQPPSRENNNRSVAAAPLYQQLCQSDWQQLLTEKYIASDNGQLMKFESKTQKDVAIHVSPQGVSAPKIPAEKTDQEALAKDMVTVYLQSTAKTSVLAHKIDGNDEMKSMLVKALASELVQANLKEPIKNFDSIRINGQSPKAILGIEPKPVAATPATPDKTTTDPDQSNSGPRCR